MDWNLNLLGKNAQLLHSSRTECITGSKERLAVHLVLEHEGELTRHCCLTRTIETSHKDNGRLLLQLEFGSLTAHEFCKLVVNELYHELSRLDGCEHVHTQSLLLHRVGKGFSHLIVYVGIKEGTAHVLERLSYVDFGDLTFTFKYLERAFKSF